MDNFDHDDVLEAELNSDFNFSKICGVPGQQLLQFAGTIPTDELKLMSQVIEEGCGQVDLNEW